MEAFLMEKATIKAGVPYDADVVLGAPIRVKMSKGDRLAIILNMGDSVAAVVDATLKQHNAASAGTSKDLSIANPYYKKAGTATVFTKVEPSSASANYVLTPDFAAQEGQVVFEVLSEDLDMNNGFAWVSIVLADTTAPKLVSVLHVAHKLRETPGYAIDGL